MNGNDRPRVLCVDDEPLILEGLTLHLRRLYEVETAPGSLAALELLNRGSVFAVIISDMRMPGMDGAALLASSRKFLPDTVRILLTGHADLESAVAAVNDGQIFRFLTKPCPPSDLLAAVGAAVEQYRLVTAERVLLEETLHGSIKTLVEVLSLTNPLAFGRATRIKQHVSDLAAKLEIRERWQVEVAAMLYQLGGVALPTAVAEKVFYGQTLSPEEEAMVARVPAVTEQLLANIPRLEVVRGILAHRRTPRQPAEGPEDAARQLVVRGGELLRIVCDFDALEARGISADDSLSTLIGREDQYDPVMLAAFRELRGGDAQVEAIREVSLNQLRVGMVLADDLKVGQILLVGHGCQITASLIERFRNLGPGTIPQPLRVIIPARKAAARPAAALVRSS